MKPATNWIETLPANRLMAEMSLWSADLARMETEIHRVEAQTDIFHVDVADGHFSPAFLFFPDLVARCRKISPKPFHVHLMVKDEVLESQIAQFAEAGADLISVHAENANCVSALKMITGLGLKAGVVLQLHTPVAAAKPLLPHISMLTLLGTRIGIKGQGLDETATTRLQGSKAMIAAAKLAHRIVLAADGGIRENTVPLLCKAGAETIVMGSLAFNDKDFASRMAWVHAQ
jgi:ribulose-phosphate 3-epimerase